MLNPNKPGMKSSAGFGFVEVLIANFVCALVIVGALAHQHQSLRLAELTTSQAHVYFSANSLIERLKVSDLDYQSGEKLIFTQDSVFPTNGFQVHKEAKEWLTELLQVVPNAQVAVDVSYDSGSGRNTADIKISWESNSPNYSESSKSAEKVQVKFDRVIFF